jgi:hypothetical protein
MARTFVEKIFDAPQGAIVFRAPDLILTHDNTSSIRSTFEQMGTRVSIQPVGGRSGSRRPDYLLAGPWYESSPVCKPTTSGNSSAGSGYV